MAYTPQMQGAPTLAQGYSVSPFLGAQIGQLGQQFNQNLQRNTLPAIRQGAIAAGGVGGSRQGIAEGIAAGDAATGFAGAATNLLGQDYQAQMARNLQKYQGDQSYNLGLGNLDLGNKNADNQYALGQANIGLGYAGLANSKDIAGMNNATTRYGIDTTAGTQRYLGDQSNATQRYGIDQNYNLGMTNANNTRYGIDQNTGLQNRNMDVTMRGQDINWQNQTNQYNLGLQQNANQRFGLENQYNLGLGQNQNQADSIRNNFYTQQRNGDQAAWDGAANLYSNTLRTAASGGAAPVDGGGFNWGGALGGAIGGMQLWNNLNKGSTSSTGWW